MEGADIMAHTYEELSKMTVTQLRAIADGIEHEATKGHSTMHKEKLLPAICIALGIEAHTHHHVIGIDKSKIKSQIRELKVQRDEAISKHDATKLAELRHSIKHLKRILRKATV
jgi:DNA-binding IclR family transcriptional regulator